MSVQFLYKYKEINDRTKSIITDSQLYFSSPAQFNDPFDCKAPLSYEGNQEDGINFFIRHLEESHGLKLGREQLDRLTPSDKKHIKECLKKQYKMINEAVNTEKLSDDEFNQRIELQIEQKFWEKLTETEFEEDIEWRVSMTREGFRIFCLSEKKDDILMWSHYANGHRGICLEFQVTKDPIFRGLQPVKYTKQYPNINRWTSTDEQRMEGQVLTKSHQWSYEKEWRIIKLVKTKTEHKYDFPENLLTGVIFGCQVDKAKKEEVIGWAMNRKNPIKFYQAKKKKREFGLDIDPVGGLV